MMPSMPRVHAEHLLQRQHSSMLRVSEAASQVRGVHRSQYGDPAQLQRIEELERILDRLAARTRQLRPGSFVIWLYGRLVFGQGDLESTVGIEMAVGHVVHDLLDRPTARSVPRLHLVARHASHRGSERTRSLGNSRDE